MWQLSPHLEAEVEQRIEVAACDQDLLLGHMRCIDMVGVAAGGLTAALGRRRQGEGSRSFLCAAQTLTLSSMQTKVFCVHAPPSE